MAKFLTAADFQDGTTTQDSRFVTADFFSDEAIAKRNSAQADLDEPKNMLSYKAQVSANSRVQDRYIGAVNQYNAAIMTEAMKQTAKNNMNAAESAIIGADPTKRFVSAPNQLAPIDTQSSYAYQVKASEKYADMRYEDLKKERETIKASHPDTSEKYKAYNPDLGGIIEGDVAKREYDRRIAKYQGETAAINNAFANFYTNAVQAANFEEIAAKGAQSKDNVLRQKSTDYYKAIDKTLRGNPPQYATDYEKRLGDYWYGISTETGNDYYRWLENILIQRGAEKLSEKADTGIEKAGLAILGGLDSALTGSYNFVQQLKGDTAVTPGFAYTANQQRISQESGLARIGLELLTTISNMAPSILVSAASGSPLLGVASFGVPVSGNAYAQMIREGKPPEQASAYGLLIGASEAGLQYALGGIGKLGKGGLSGFLNTTAGKAIATKLDDALKIVVKSPKTLAALESAAKYFGNAGSEAIEEALQEILEPAFREAVTGEKTSAELSQILESALLGGLSALLLNAPGAISGRNQTAQTTPQTAEPAAPVQPVAPTQPEAPAVTAKPTTAQGITQTLKSTGEISAAQIDTIVKSPENRAVFTQETGVELPAAVGDARRAIRAYQADINSTQANTAAQPATIDADATSPQTGVDAPSAQAAVVEPLNAIYGKEGKTYTKDNDAINFTYAVVDVNDLITSNDVYGNVNPNYPVELQPRDRTRVASQAQVQEMAKKLNPELLGASPTAQNGAPIIGADGVVEGGNGRVNAIALAYQTNGAKNYKQYIIDNAAEYGIDVSRLPAKPVLVRVNASTESRADVAKKLNQSTISTYSSTESALTDASKIGTILDDFVPNDDGTINTADNKKFISRFINEVAPASERNSLVTSDGWLSQSGLERVKNAIFAAVYNDAGLLARLSENLDDNSKNVIRALLNTASNALSIKSRIDNGVLYDIDLSGDVLQAARLYEQLKRSKTEIEDYFAQSALLDDGYSDEAKVLAWFFSKHKRGARAMTGFINTIYQTVEDLGSPEQTTLGDESFGADETKASVLESAIRSYERENGETLSIPEFQRKDSSISATEALGEKPQSAVTPQTATAVTERPTQADTDTDAEIAENKVGEGDVWQTTRIGTDEDVKSLTQIVKQAYTDLDIPIIRGGIKGRRSVQGQYRTASQTIHVRTNNDILTIAHEVGHHLDAQHGLVDTASPVARQELLNNLSPGMVAAYKANQLPAEGVAEFFRYYFTNADEANAAYPEFSAHVDNKLPQKTLDVINRLAQSMNTYLSAPVYEQYLSAVSMSTDNAPTLAEKWQGVKDKFTEYFIDDLAGLKRFGDAVENTRSYILAQNSRYASGTVDALLKIELRDMNGKYVGESLLKAVEDINVKDADELRAFNLYLILKHAPERIGDMKKVFANPELESQTNIDASVAKLEAQYPSFASAADRVYQFQKNLLKAYGVDSGLISQRVADEWGKKYPHYIPLQRDLSNTKKKSAKSATSKVNQSLSPFKAAKGSGLDILAPLEGIVWNTNRMVLAAKSNAVRIATTEAAATTVGAGKFLEREKAPTEIKRFNAIELKANTIEALKNNTGVDENVLKNVIDSVIEDTLEQYTRSSKIQDNIMLVMKNGEPQYWRVNDTMLLHSLENVGTQTVKGFWDAYGKVTRVITQAATGGNVIWSIFSNALRDIQTGAIYDRSGKTGKWLLNIGKAYYQQVTDKAAREKGLTPSRMSEYYREYLSLGGANNISRISADRADTAKSFSGLLSKKQYLNPFDAIASVSDVIEQAPRFAEYASLREKGVQAGNAFYQAMDVTVNFRRGGTWSRQINKAIPFYNASIQGLDKMFRNFTAADVPVSSRKKIMTRRFAKYAALSAIVAFAQIVPKLFDEDEKKDYEQLSAYQKNGAYNIYLGDGKFFSIRKPRELGILTSFFERTMEYALLTNKDAYYDFANYASEQILPPLLDVLPLVASGDMDAVGGSLASTFGASGSLFALTLNVDYRGNPIVSDALGRLQPKFQYDESTSYLAKTLGGMLNLSPKKIDYALNTWLGMYQTVNKSLFPVGGAERDWTLGVANTYVKDNQYSQDIVNKFYTGKTATDKNSASYPDKSAYKIQSKDYDSMAQFYSNTVKIAQNTDMTTPLNRAARQTVLEMLEQFSSEIDSGNSSPIKQSMDNLAAETGDTSFYPQTMGVVFTYTPNKGNRVEIALTYTQYLQYQTAYNAYYYNEVGKALNKSYKNADDKMSAVQKAKREAKEKIDKEMFSLLTGRK